MSKARKGWHQKVRGVSIFCQKRVRGGTKKLGGGYFLSKARKGWHGKVRGGGYFLASKNEKVGGGGYFLERGGYLKFV